MIHKAQQSRAATANERPIQPDDNVLEVWPLELGTSRSYHLPLYLRQFLRDFIPKALIAMGDFCGLLIAGKLAALLHDAAAPLTFRFAPMLVAYSGIMALAYAAGDIYFGATRSGPDELRRVTLTTTALMAIIASVTYFSRGRLVVDAYALAWIVALFTIPLGRAIVRALFGGRGWWGRKAVIFAHDIQTARRVIKALRAQPRLALKPVAVLTAGAQVSDEWDIGLPLLHGTWAGVIKAKLRGVDHAIIAMPNLNDTGGLEIIRRYEFMFKHWTIVPYFVQNYSMWVETHELNGLIGLQLTHRLLVPTHQALKRVLDIVLTLLGSVIALPLGLLIALSIKIDSKGPILYGQRRLGKDGKPFRMLKFRSMIQNADAVLDQYLAKHPELRDEWNATQKLKKDPRITGLGRFLRATSLDELPQLLNVLRGEMSLVGPRPIVNEEIFRYDWVWEFYKRVRPGITGHWQISGRSETTYKDRTAMDAYYIRNWSVWLDIYILIRTIPTVLRRDGAY